MEFNHIHICFSGSKSMQHKTMTKEDEDWWLSFEEK
jgi:hypothetical protein